MAVALSLFGIAQCQASGEEYTTVHSTSTTTLSLTSTITVQANTPTALQRKEMQKGEVYILQGCYGQGEPSNVETMLGSNVTVRNAAGKDGMSLSMCLNFCKSPASPEIKPRDEQSLSLFVGLSEGKACYCGGLLNSTAKEVQPTNCTLPCAGNNAVACGGAGYMLVYKLSTPSESGKKQGDGPYEDHTGSKGRPGVTAGIALGSISGFALLAFLIFYGAKMYKRRRQRQASGSDEHGAGGDGAGDTPPAGSAANTGKTNRVDLRNVDPIVINFAPLSGDLRASDAPRPKQIIAASTGAEWRTGNPGTPRAAVDAAPKLATNGTRNDGWDDIPHTPTILVQHPESVAQNPGLGERAWHRRRFSTPQPPAGYRYSDGPDAFAGGSSRGPGKTQTSQGTGEVGSAAPWEDDWDSLMPAPLTLPPLGHGAGGASARSEEDGGPLTAKTMWTVPSDPSLSGCSGKTVERGGKTGKTE